MVRTRHIVCLLAALAAASAARASQDSLRATYAASQQRLHNNPFGRALFLNSFETRNSLKGEIYARVDQPFARVREALAAPGPWCEALLLPFNVKFCAVQAGPRLILNIGRKFDQPLEDTHSLDFAFALKQATPDYLQVQLSAVQGPVGTRDYQIEFEAMPLPGNQTFLHLSYAYGYGWSSRLAARTYFATSGRAKIGFTAEGGGHVAGLRGAVERNAMRYHLAIDAFLRARTAPPAQRFEQSIQGWFTATEQYPLQLHEMERAEYLAMKRKEYLRQQP